MKLKNTLAIVFVILLGGLSDACAQKYVGGDISLLTKYEQGGATYYDNNGKRITQVLPWFKEQGLNAMRVRLFVDPSKAPADEIKQGVCQDLDFVKALGKRIKDQGFALMLDFHYSDSWADPGKQFTPNDWTSLNDAALQTKIYEYTKQALAEMVAAGASPDFIQTGNEISYGMLWGARNSSSLKKYYPGQSNNRDRFTGLLKKAGEACREICPDAKIIIHTERVAQPNVLTSFYTDMKNAQVDYDIIGLSFYPFHHGNLNALETALNTLERTFSNKDIMIVETGYYHAWQPSDVSHDLSATYPINETGQKQFTDALIAKLNNHPHVTGLFWWFMEANEKGIPYQQAVTPSGWYNAGLFDNQTGRALSALSSLKDFAPQQTGIESSIPNASQGKKASSNSTVYGIDGRLKKRTRGINIVDGKKIIEKR